MAYNINELFIASNLRLTFFVGWSATVGVCFRRFFSVFSRLLLDFVVLSFDAVYIRLGRYQSCCLHLLLHPNAEFILDKSLLKVHIKQDLAKVLMSVSMEVITTGLWYIYIVTCHILKNKQSLGGDTSSHILTNTEHCWSRPKDRRLWECSGHSFIWCIKG